MAKKPWKSRAKRRSTEAAKIASERRSDDAMRARWERTPFTRCAPAGIHTEEQAFDSSREPMFNSSAGQVLLDDLLVIDPCAIIDNGELTELGNELRLRLAALDAWDAVEVWRCATRCCDLKRIGAVHRIAAHIVLESITEDDEKLAR